MSNAQRLYLQQRILFKISQAEEDLRRSIGHQSLLRRLQPLVEDMDRDFNDSPLAVNRAMKEGTSWWAADRHERLKTFEDRLMTLFSTRFEVARFIDQTRRDTSPQPKLVDAFNQYETIVEE